eukprot:8603348-Heterocapsa_arctica.AAC.1
MSPCRSASGDMTSVQSVMSSDRSDPYKSNAELCPMYWKSRTRAWSRQVSHFDTFAARRVMATRMSGRQSRAAKSSFI